MRFVKAHLSPHVERCLSPGQFGGRSGRSPAMATHHLMENVHAHAMRHECTHIILLDVRNAFSSVPFALLIALLQKRCFPPAFIELFSHVLHQGAFHMKCTEEYFHASSGIRQGCPLSAMFFVLFYELFLRILAQWDPTAFVDDVAAVTNGTEATRELFSQATFSLQRMGMQLNVTKSEVLVLGSGTPMRLEVSSPPSMSMGG